MNSIVISNTNLADPVEAILPEPFIIERYLGVGNIEGFPCATPEYLVCSRQSGVFNLFLFPCWVVCVLLQYKNMVDSLCFINNSLVFKVNKL